MKLTRMGGGFLFMAALTFMAAASSGNNLLYLLLSAIIAAVLVSWAAGRWNLGRVRFTLETPAQVFRGAQFPLRIRLETSGAWPALSLVLIGPEGRSTAASALAERPTIVETPYRLPHRGVNALDGLALESPFPFGLLLHRKTLSGGAAIAFPRTAHLRSAREIRAETSETGAIEIIKSRGGEFYGVREAQPEEDARLINWKLTARTGRPVANEYVQASGAKVTVRLGPLGEETEAEARIEDAASACRFYIDAGSEVRLVTEEGTIDYGKGLLHLDKLYLALSRLGAGKRPRPAGLRPAEAGYGQLRDSRTLRRLTRLGGMLVYASLLLIDELDWRFLACLAPLLPLGWWLEERGGPRPPQRLWDAVSLAVLAFVVLFDWRLAGVTLGSTHLLIYIIINRALTPLKIDDLRLVMMAFCLAFFLVSGQTISLWYFLCFLLYFLFCGMWLLTAAGGRWDASRPWAGTFAACMLATLLLSAAIFTIMPRFEPRYAMNPFIAMGLDKLHPHESFSIGFTENVTLGFFGSLKKSSVKVMQVSPSPAPSGGAAPEILIRGAAYDHFDGRRWSKSAVDFRFLSRGRPYKTAGGRAWARQRGGRLVFPWAEPARGTRSWEFTIFPMNLSVLFTVGGPYSVEDRSNPTAYIDYTDSAYFGVPYGAGERYSVAPSRAASGAAFSISGYDRLLADRFMQLPENSDPRTVALANRLTAKAPDEPAKIKAVTDYLRRACDYSTLSARKNRDLEDFLFKSRNGNCEYFATAAAILLRHAGVPTRLATGFLAGDFNEFGRFYDVRQGQAHAWTEAYIRGRGWVAFDPTPGAESFSRSVLNLLQRYLDSLEARWYRHVIGYDQLTQRNTFHRVGQAVTRQVLEGSLRSAWRGLADLAGLAAIAFAAARLRRRLRRKRGAGTYERAQAFLERSGLPRRPCWTPREYAAWVAAVEPRFSAIGPLAEFHYLERYSGRRLGVEDRLKAEELLILLKSRA